MKIIIFVIGVVIALSFLMILGWSLSKHIDDELEENKLYKTTERWLQLEIQNAILCWLFAVICGVVSVYVFT